MGKKRIIFSTGLSAISKTKYLKIEYFVRRTLSDKTIYIKKLLGDYKNNAKQLSKYQFQRNGSQILYCLKAQHLKP